MAEKNKFRNWTQENMQRAFEAATNGVMSISTAAKTYGVPRMTLSDRVNGKIAVDAYYGHQVALSTSEETSLANYINYMHEHRFPITKLQVMGLAWAIDMDKPRESRVFGETGPSNKWWRGFKSRHPNLTLRKPESVDRGRVLNATKDVIDDYFDTLESIIATNDIGPHATYNCDEASVLLNKSAQRVVVPRNSKHCHTRTQGTSEHISVLCCVNAAGGTVPPMVVFSKGLPTLRGFHEQGPVNASYAASDSGFVNKDIYTQWFEKTFLKHASPARPLLLIQDGATAHISLELIEMAVANQVILLCLPAKLTHLLQPCDVVIYKRMRSEIAKVMQAVKMLRGDLWVTKSRFPTIFKEVFENTFTPSIVINSFRKCGIYPLDRKAISQDLVAPAKLPTAQDGHRQEAISGNHSVCAEVSLDVVSEIPVDAQVVELPASETDDQTKACPPELALQAVQSSLTPRKLAVYEKRYKEGVIRNDDPVYMTWTYLRKTTNADATKDVVQLPSFKIERNPLVDAGLIPQGLANILVTPPENTGRIIRRKSAKARVLTCDDLTNEIREKEEEKRVKLQEKENRKQERILKKSRKDQDKEKVTRGSRKRKSTTESTGPSKTKKKTTKPSTDKGCPSTKQQTVDPSNVDDPQHSIPVQNLGTLPSAPNTERQRYFSHVQAMLASCKSVEAMRAVAPPEIPYTISWPFVHQLHPARVDTVAQELLMSSLSIHNMSAIAIYGDGNCLPRAASYLCTGDETVMHVEMRVRIVLELLSNADH